MSNTFAYYFSLNSPKLPNCCKYIKESIFKYLCLNVNIDPYIKNIVIKKETLNVTCDNYISFTFDCVIFNLNYIEQSLPEDITIYIGEQFKDKLTNHQQFLLNFLCTDRWYKGDFKRLSAILLAPLEIVKKLTVYACNCLWERSYEDKYPLGLQFCIRITTKFIQSGLDFKHTIVSNECKTQVWSDGAFDKFLNSLSTLSDIIKRHKYIKKYVVLELDTEYYTELITLLREDFKDVITNANVNNVCAITMDDDKDSRQYLLKLSDLVMNKQVNVLFVTDVEVYYKSNNFLFYLYNSLKLYYYCLTKRFVFLKEDYEIIFLIVVIVYLEWFNGGHLNGFTLEKSQLSDPLESSSRRVNSLKSAATSRRTLNNCIDMKIDYIKGSKVNTGMNSGPRLATICTGDTMQEYI